MGEMTSSWAVLLGLGAFHGINPGMGWLFAVALGLQERRRGAVLSALLPLGVGHALAVGAALVFALLAGAVMPLQWLRWVVAAILIGFGVSRLLRHRHPSWARMQVSKGGLTLWSFLMASAHGAGLMVVPVFLGMAMPAAAHEVNHGSVAAQSATPATALLATSLHAVGYLVVTAAVALLVFERLGVAILRKAWFNVDLIWAIALIATGVIGVLL
jgi:hypothetical protein